MKRALRRHHRNRLKRNRKSYDTVTYWGITEEDLELRSSKAVDTPCSCSCQACGNPRRQWFERTRKEVLWDFIEKEGKDEVFGLQVEDSLI